MSTSVSSPISVDTGGTADDVPALVDIGFHPAPVRTTRSRWVPIGIATFAGLTCLGLATTTFFPSVTDRGSERDRGSAAASGRADSSRDPADRAVAATLPREPASPGSWREGVTVVAPARVLAGSSGGTRTILVSGASTPDVSRIDIEVRIANRVVGRSEVVPSRPAADVAADVDSATPIGNALIAWSAVIDVPVSEALTDGVAIATLDWPIPASSAFGSTSLVLVLSDRGSEERWVSDPPAKPAASPTPRSAGGPASG